MVASTYSRDSPVTLPDGWTTDAVEANGVELQYYRTGEGPPLVLAHGLFDTGRCWAPLVADLAADYTVVTYDARGHGRSAAPETGYGLDDRVADLVGLLDGLSVTDPVLVGHSMGGSTVAWAAARHSERPRGVVLEDPAGLHGDPETGPDERAAAVRDRVETRAEQPVAEIATEYDDRDSDLARRLAVADRECSPTVAEIVRHGFPPLGDAFAEIDAPTLVLNSDAEPSTRAADLAVADELPAGRLVHVPGAGHCVFRDRSDAAVAELRTFLRRIE